MRAHSGYQLSARGKPDHSNVVRRNAPLRGAASHQSNRALHIWQGMAVNRIRRSWLSRQTVLNHESGYSVIT